MDTRAMLRYKYSIAIVVISAAAVVGAVLAARPLGEWFLARQYAGRLEQTSDRGEAEAIMRQAASPQDERIDRKAGEPKWFNAPTATRPLFADRRPPDVQKPAHVAERMSYAATDVDDSTAVQVQAAAGSDGGPDVSRSELSRAETVELLQRLKSADAASAAAVKNELLCRGFRDRHFKIAERLFHPDPAERMEAARALPGIPQFNPVPWLMVLAEDANADVRLTAITLLATTADPAVLAEVESLARRDGDPRIQSQAKLIAQRMTLR